MSKVDNVETSFLAMSRRIIPYNPKLKERARELRKKMTPGEVKLWRHLRRKQLQGFDFDRQRPIDQFIVDFYCKDLMLAIEIDGSSHDGELAQNMDMDSQQRIEVLGVAVLRFTEREVVYNLDSVLEKIIAFISAHKHQA